MAAAKLGAMSGRETPEAASAGADRHPERLERAFDFMAKDGISGVIGGGSAFGDYRSPCVINRHH